MGAGTAALNRPPVRPARGGDVSNTLRTYRYPQQPGAGRAGTRRLHLRGFAGADAVRYLRRLLQNEKHANSEQPTQLFSI